MADRRRDHPLTGLTDPASMVWEEIDDEDGGEEDEGDDERGAGGRDSGAGGVLDDR